MTVTGIAKLLAWAGCVLALAISLGCRRYAYQRVEGKSEPIYEADPTHRVEWVSGSGDEMVTINDYRYPDLHPTNLVYHAGGTVHFTDGSEIDFPKIAIFSKTDSKRWIITKFPSPVLEDWGQN